MSLTFLAVFCQRMGVVDRWWTAPTNLILGGNSIDEQCTLIKQAPQSSKILLQNRKTPIVKEVVLTTLKAKYMCIHTQ